MIAWEILCRWSIGPALLCPILAAAAPPEWSGAGRHRVLVRVEPVEMGERPRDEMVARWSVDWARIKQAAGATGEIDLGSLQVHRFDPETEKAEAFATFDNARSGFDRPCRFEDDAVPDAYPDRIGAASDQKDGRSPLTTRSRGGRLFNRQMQPTTGRIVWTHTQSGAKPSHYAIYFDVQPDGEKTGPAPSPWIGDVDLYRRETGAPLSGMSHLSICTGDLDGDGLFDILAGMEKGHLMYFANQGSVGQPRFVGCTMLADEAGPIDVGWYCCPVVTNWDADDLPDLLVGTMHDVILWWKNTGTRGEPKLVYQGFVQADGQRLSVPASPIPEDKAGLFKVDYFDSPTVCDWDGDGLPDILTGGYVTGRIFLYRGVGRDEKGVPRLEYVGPLEADGEPVDTGWAAAPIAHDFDDDGDLDLITGSWDFQQGHNPDKYLMCFENVGTKAKPALQRRPLPKDGAFPKTIIARASVVDWDHDGLSDLLVGDHGGEMHVLLNKGTRREPKWLCDGSQVTGSWCFVPLDLSQGPEDYSILTYDYMVTSTADLDGDGRVELISGDEVHSLAGPPHSPRLVRLGELMVDGRPLTNAGPGYGDFYNWNVLWDWDKDGRLDVLCGTQQGNIFFHRGKNGHERLAYEPGVKLRLKSGEDLKVGPQVRDDPSDVKDFTELQGSRIKFVVADIDTDGVDDLVITETFNNIWVFRNSLKGGTDTLEPGVQAIKLPTRTRLNIVDFNNDGRPDIIDGNSIDNPGTIHLNESEPGQVKFAAPIQPLGLPWVFYGSGFFPIDWNGDGDEDFLIQSEYYLFWAERSFAVHGYREAMVMGEVESRMQGTK